MTLHTYLFPFQMSRIDALDRSVRTLVDAGRAPGLYRVIWDGSDDNGVAVASRVCFCRISWNGQTETKRMALLRQPF